MLIGTVFLRFVSHKNGYCQKSKLQIKTGKVLYENLKYQQQLNKILFEKRRNPVIWVMV